MGWASFSVCPKERPLGLWASQGPRVSAAAAVCAVSIAHCTLQCLTLLEMGKGRGSGVRVLGRDGGGGKGQKGGTWTMSLFLLAFTIPPSILPPLTFQVSLYLPFHLSITYHRLSFFHQHSLCLFSPLPTFPISTFKLMSSCLRFYSFATISQTLLARSTIKLYFYVIKLLILWEFFK